jgi:hypothetical protein
MVLMGRALGISSGAHMLVRLVTLGLVACGGNGKPTSNPASAGSNSGIAGTLGSSGSQGSAGSSSGGVASAGSANGGVSGSTASGGSDVGEAGSGGESLGEDVCSTDSAHCFRVLHRQWVGTGNAGVHGVAFDSIGNVLTAASTLGSLQPLTGTTGSDVLVKWTPTLDLSWAIRRVGISRALALDPEDNAFIASVYGFDPDVKSTPGLDIVVTKVAADGSELWSKRVASPLYDEASSLAADGDGNSVVGGFTFGKIADDPDVGAGDALLVKLAPNGDQLWAHQFGSTGFDAVRDNCVDAEGNHYATGAVAGTFASAAQGEGDLFVVKLSSLGEQLWAKQLGSAAVDGGTGIACGKDAIYVTGITAGRLDEPTAAAPAQSDIVLIKYDFAGNQLWLKQWLTTGQERFPKLAVGPSGNVFVTGGSSTDLDQDSGNGPGGETDLFVGEWTADGALLWTYQYGSDSWDTAMGVAVSPTGRIAVGADVQAPLPQFASLASGGAVVTVLTPTAPE